MDVRRGRGLVAPEDDRLVLRLVQCILVHRSVVHWLPIMHTGRSKGEHCKDARFDSLVQDTPTSSSQPLIGALVGKRAQLLSLIGPSACVCWPCCALPQSPFDTCDRNGVAGLLSRNPAFSEATTLLRRSLMLAPKVTCPMPGQRLLTSSYICLSSWPCDWPVSAPLRATAPFFPTVEAQNRHIACSTLSLALARDAQSRWPAIR